MSCPTCSNTMQSVFQEPTMMEACGTRYVTVFWCPRCGTIRTTRDGQHRSEDQRPTLVDRARRFRDLANLGDGLTARDAALWHRLGLAESIELPEVRYVP